MKLTSHQHSRGYGKKNKIAGEPERKSGPGKNIAKGT